MLETMKKEISGDIKKANGTVKITADEIKTVVENAVFKATKSAKNGATEINSIAKEAVISAVEELKKSGHVEKARIDAVMIGLINGIEKSTKESINDMEMEMLKSKFLLEEKNAELSTKFKETLDGAKEAAVVFTDESKKHIEEAVNDTKLKSVQMLGLMEGSIKRSVKTVIEEGSDVEEKISHITHEVVKNALDKTRLSVQNVKEVSSAVIVSSIEAAQEAGKDIEKTTKGAIEGTKRGVIETINATKVKLSEAKESSIDFVEEDIKQTIEDLEALDDAFIDVLSSTANKVGDISKLVIEESIKEIKTDASQLKDIALDAAEVAIEYLKEKGIQVAYSTKEKAYKIAQATKEEIVDISDKMVEIAKGAFSGMVDGVKKAIKKEEEK
jgi:hypothetical protein